MALPKGKLMALLAVFAAIGIVTATGAFTQVTADRTVTASTSGDASALLALQPFDGPNGDGENNVQGIASSEGTDTSDGYAGLSDGTLAINLAGFSNNNANLGSGLNYNANTTIKNVFVVTNQGTQQITVSISDSDDDTNPAEEDMVTFFSSNSTATHLNNGGLEGQNSITLDPGVSMVVSINIDTTGYNESNLANDGLLDQGFTIQATATG